ncbi:TetR/AcrR family transcriptional regulator [Sphingobium sp.]|uniref:TetR/AcrR family transcriptional regulator n=1 Tax=Sphingobium sp. TaxID=1912891 RepID=UPI0028BEEBDE|nr:TetR/AcrR family transcriptional regulator [Sphingobium sp.]
MLNERRSRWPKALHDHDQAIGSSTRSKPRMRAAVSTPAGEARRRALLKKAEEMFLMHGFDSVSIDALIGEVGGSRRNVYDTFGGKEGLFEGVVSNLCEEYVRPIAELEIAASPAREALIDFADRLLTCVLEPRALALQRLMIAEAHRMPRVSHAIFSSGHQRVSTILAAWIVERQSDGILRADLPPEELADSFINIVITGAHLKALIGLTSRSSEPEDIRGIATRGTCLFIDGAQSGAGKASREP